MNWEYYYENHDWDMTLASAKELLDAGNRVPVSATENRSISYYTASMLLAFCSVESFVNSLAFLLHNAGAKGFNYKRYGRISGIWNRLQFVAQALNYEVDQKRQPYSTFARMRDWRNELVHSKPFSIEPKLIADPSDARDLTHDGAKSSYKLASRQQARRFCRCAHVIIARFHRASNLVPTTFVTYRNLITNETIKIQRKSVKLDPSGN